MSDTVTDEARDTQMGEYLTYAPEGARCSACKKVIEPLEPVRREGEDRVSGPPIVFYRHVNAKACPDRAKVAG